MTGAWVAALGASVAFGVAAVLQALASTRAPETAGIDPRLLLALVRQPAFLAALALTGVGFLLHVVALQWLPLFLVQAVIASSVAVTALLSVHVFGVPLTRAQWASLGAVVVGLTLLAPSAEQGEALPAAPTTLALLLGAVLLTAGAALVAARLHGTPEAVLLGLLAGTGFGLVAVCARLLPRLDLAALGEPVTGIAVVAGLLAFLLYSTALQQGSATVVTAALVVPQTAVPAAVGLALGDRVSAGLAPMAAVGFVVALTGALGLARFERPAPAPQR